MRSAIFAFVAGVVFALGLAIAGMTLPAKVLGFLDISGDWDPSLAFVMVGAIGTHTILRRPIVRRKSPWFRNAFHAPTRSGIDRNLVIGAMIFGVGWGLGGYCPGPAVVSAGTGSLTAIVFVATMAVGMIVHDRVRS